MVFAEHGLGAALFALAAVQRDRATRFFRRVALLVWCGFAQPARGRAGTVRHSDHLLRAPGWGA
ncbi:hypothetical protein GCM10008961_31810 [Deinococcus knuensis]|uniref:Uncharacterized protein n=1 Tax=Deinococcus knuensis TaxID=1837380 RepID=A0ABQ2STS0_9DEIO|nr:hypothetical protein GCM10008961_31810 [Deinococcus knuensis]